MKVNINLSMEVIVMRNQNLLKTKEAAEYLNISVAFLERDRWAGARIPFIKVGRRAVRYRLDDLKAYLDSHMKMSTSE